VIDVLTTFPQTISKKLMGQRYFIILLTLFPALVCAQKNLYQGFPSLVWPKLYDITFIKAQDRQGEYQKPVFSKGIKALEGKLISVPGYMVPFENGIKSSHFMLSSLPLNACFFCGVGGVETVMEIFLKKEASYTEKPVEVRGVFRLNQSEPDQMIYILDQAEITGEAGF
jgi:hypothetical protein